MNMEIGWNRIQNSQTVQIKYVTSNQLAACVLGLYG